MTNDELRAKIARAMGWKCYLTTYSIGDRHWSFDTTKDSSNFIVQEEAFSPKREDTVSWLGVPDWTGDLNAAIGLKIKEFRLLLEETGNGWDATFYTCTDRRFKETARTPARAICLAWLAAQEAK